MSIHIITSEKILENISIENIRSVHGKTKILENFSTYLMDESKLDGDAEWIFFPKSEIEIASILKYAKKNNIKLCISAARTGIVGSSVPSGGLILSTENMKEIIGFGFDKNRGNYFIRVEPGVTLNELNDIILKKELDSVSELTLNAIKSFKNSNSLFHYPVDPTEMSATIGGNVATNASGANSLKYGPTREWVKRMRIMLSSGEILEIPRGKYFASKENEFILIKSDGVKLQFKIPDYVFNTTVKNAAGIYSKPNMDLIDLFIGSEGILGIIIEIDIWIVEKQALISNVLFFNSEEDSINFTEELSKNTIIAPEFIEFFSVEALELLRDIQNKDPSALKVPQIPKEAKSAIFFDFLYTDEDLDTKFTELNKISENCNTNLSNGWSGYESQDIARFKHFRHILPEVINAIIAERKQKFPELHKLGTDMSVPKNHFRKMIRFYHSVLDDTNLDYVIFGHIGDSHVHVNILPKNMEELKLGEMVYEEFAKKAVGFGGSISGEHGIGKIKREYLKIMYSQREINEMRLLKQNLDPNLILNYGNIVNFDNDDDLPKNL
ncbi:MAG: FAD-binding oxidoreductase [Candidatus Thorarchaeota archaeon]